MKRREFLVLSSATFVAWPFAARAQLPNGSRRIGVLTDPSADDPLAKSQIASFQKALEMYNVGDIDLIFRGGAADPRLAAANAKDLVALRPDVIVVASTPGVAALLRETTTVAIVFVKVADPEGSGFVKSIERPGVVTGFTNFELSMAGKWVQMIKEMASTTQRVLAVYDPGTRPSADYLRVAQVAAASSKLEFQSVPIQGPPDIERAINAYASKPYGARPRTLLRCMSPYWHIG
jgi:ABC-type uncharacterized transport system substrate-binding protein